MKRSLLLLGGAFLLSGCLWPVREKTDAVIGALASHPFDVGCQPGHVEVQPITDDTTIPPRTRTPDKKDPRDKKTGAALPPPDIQTTAFLQEAGDKPRSKEVPPLPVPAVIPGAATPRLPNDETELKQELARLVADMPPLPDVPPAQPGPDGHPYTLSDLQRIAAENSPTLHQAAADVQNAHGLLVQSRLYPNPTITYEADTVNNGATAGFQGVNFTQPLRSAGKIKLNAAMAQKDLDNAELALKRARFDLATQVRNAYFGLLVARETVRVTRGLAQFTDEMFRLQASIQKGSLAAPYEPLALRAQANLARLAYRQAIQSYLYAWKQMTTAVGLCQLPLSEVAGRIDRIIPCFDYDTVKERVLHHHTDVLTAFNAIEKSRYQLKLAQITPWFQDPTLTVVVQKDNTVPPFLIAHNVLLGMPISVWDQNQGNIIAAQAALIRAGDQPHTAELNLTASLNTAYGNYATNLLALEDYRRRILPDLMRTIQGVHQARQLNLGAVGVAGVAFADLFNAQQLLATSVTAYLNNLGQAWTAVVQVADLLQTDDLFQCAKPLELPPLPSFGPLPKFQGVPEVLPPPGPAGPKANGPTEQSLPVVTTIEVPLAPVPTVVASTPPTPLPSVITTTLPPASPSPVFQASSPPKAPLVPFQEGNQPPAVNNAINEQLLEPPPPAGTLPER